MNSQNIDRPVRIRGSVCPNSDNGRSRGAVRNRAAAPAVAASSGLENAVDWLSEQVNGFPLTHVVHAAGGSAGHEFLDELSRTLHEGDAVWLVTASRADAAPEWSDVLPLDESEARRIYENLVADLVFFPAQQAAELGQLNGWRDRARLIVAPKANPFADELLRDAEAQRIRVLRWPVS